MSYARTYPNRSDVYVFGSINGHLECCGCKIIPRNKPTNVFMYHFVRWLSAWMGLLEEVIIILTLGYCFVSIGKFKFLMWSLQFGNNSFQSFTCKRYSEMITHLQEHRNKNQLVPQSAFDRLRREMLDGNLFAPEYVDNTPEVEADVNTEEIFDSSEEDRFQKHSPMFSKL